MSKKPHHTATHHDDPQPAPQAETPPPEPKNVKWAYKTLVLTCRNESELRSCEGELNKFGADGWELVSAFIVSETYQVYHFKMQGNPTS